MATYQIGKRIGSGGFGEVYEAARSTDDATVAIKYLRDVDEASLARFKREIRCLEKLSHPNIVSIIGKKLEAEPYFYVMPLYHHSLYAEFPSILGDYAKIRHIFRSILDALHFAHTEGVLHRDLKPENILISDAGNVVVNDFGLGRIITSASTRLTMTGSGMGTPFYCAPEQMLDAKNADEKSDIYSLGKILYDLFGGLNSGVVDLDDVPIPIASIIRRATRKRPAERYQTVTSLAEAFELAMDILMGQVGPDSLEALIEQTDDVTKIDATGLQNLQAALAQSADNGEVIHEVMMKIVPSVFAVLTKENPDLMRHLAKTFSRFQDSQVWGFSYTDTIGAAIEALFYSTSDSVVRAHLLRAVLVVGTGHNRWDVMRTFASMLSSIEANDEAAEVWSELREEKTALERVANYVDKAKLRPVLAKLF